MPSVSVVIPTYNRATLIKETLESVLAQTYKDYEIIVVDDGSTDDTRQVVSAYGDAVRYLCKHNGGQGSARNMGIRSAVGQYIAFLDSDDLWFPQKLEQQMAILNYGKHAWAYSDTELFDSETGNTLGLHSKMVLSPHDGDIARHLLLGDFIACLTTVVRRDVFEKVGYFDESAMLRNREDWEMWLRIASRFPVTHVPHVLAKYRVHSERVSHLEDPLRIHQSLEMAIEKAVAFAPEVYGPLKQAALARVYVRTGRTLAGEGNLTEARKMFRQALAINPLAFDALSCFIATLAGKSATEKLSQLRKRLGINW